MDRRLLFAVAIAATLVLGVVLIRLGTAPGVPEATGRQAERGPATSRSELPASEPVRGLPAKFPRSRDGAVAAATAYGLALDGPAVFDATHRARVLDDIAADATRAELTAAFGDGLRLVREQLHLDDQATSDPEFVWRVVPGGWQTRAYDRTSATVAIWAAVVVLVGDRPLVEPGWQTTEVELIWEREAWRLVGFDTVSGPDPADAAVAGAGGEPVGRRINAFHPYRHWPQPSDGEALR